MKLTESKKLRTQEVADKKFLKDRKRTVNPEDRIPHPSSQMPSIQSRTSPVNRTSFRQKNSVEKVGEIMHEAQKAGYQIIEHNPESENIKISKKKKYQDYSISQSQIIDDNDDFYDFSHYANTMNTSLSPEASKKKNKIKKYVEEIKTHINYFKQVKYALKADIRILVDEQSKIINSILQQNKEIEVMWKQKLKESQQSYRLLRKENQIIKKQARSLKAELQFIKQMAQKDKFITESLEKSLIGEKDFDAGNSLLKKQIEDLKKVNSELKNTQIGSYRFKKSSRQNTLDTSQKQYQNIITEMKQRYLKCMSKFSEQISSFEQELIKIKSKKNQSEEIEKTVLEKQQKISYLEELVKEKQFEIQVLSRNIEAKIQEAVEMERNKIISMQQRKLRETTRTKMDEYPYFANERKYQIISSERWGRNPNIHERRNPYFSPNSTKDEYFSNETQQMAEKSKDKFRNRQEHLKFKNRIQQIQQNAKRDLNQIIGKVN